MRRFNVTGLCTPEEDYMVDISGKIKQIKQLIDRRCYFTINRARQYGKTTTLNELCKVLADEYIAVSLSFQGIGDESFSSSELFCQTFIKQVARALRFTSVPQEYVGKWNDCGVSDFDELSRHISNMCEGKKLVLIIDEVDRTSNNRVFLHFIDMLRDKFLSRKAGRDHTFHSVILAGVYDIKNIKLKMIAEGLYVPTETENKLYNSPWNIAADFEVDMSFNPAEIETMLREYETDHNTGMDISEIAEDIFRYTSGYPFLVSRICQRIDEKLNKEWTIEGVQEAVSLILDEDNTLFDDMFKNIRNHEKLREILYEVLFIGKEIPFGVDDEIINLGRMFGFLKNMDGKTKLSNKIFELRIYNYFILQQIKEENSGGLGTVKRSVIQNGQFDMEMCLRKFAEHYSELFSKKDIDFLERHGRLLFLSYLKPLINGDGFYHVESEISDYRMDIVVDFGREQFIIELKIWKGEKAEEKAYEQLLGYMETKKSNKGYLLIFDFRLEKNKERKSDWVDVDGKKIFEVIV